MTVYCYDTEFLEDGSTIELISIGIVCEDGREYYAVNHDADWKRIEKDDWLMTNVVPHLPMRRGEKPYKFEGRSWIWGLDMGSTLVKPKWLIANEVREFLLARPDGVGPGEWAPDPELWAYYAAYDHVALAQLWGPMISLPKGIPMWTHDLMQLVEPLRGFQKPPQDGDEHNALADARWNYGLLLAAREAPGGGVVSRHPTDVVQRAKAALEGVTERPWVADVESARISGDPKGYSEVVWPGRVDCMSYCYGGTSTIDGENLPADLAFIAAARHLVPDLVAEVERLRGVSQ